MYEFAHSLASLTIELMSLSNYRRHMDQQILVMGVPSHLVTIRGQMVFKAFGSIVFFKCWHFELRRYDKVRDQA